MTPARIAFVAYVGALLGFEYVGYNDRAVVVFAVLWGIFALICAWVVDQARQIQWRRPPRAW